MKLIKIKKIKVFKMNLALHEPFSISFKTYTQAQNEFVVIETDEGIKGYGEGSPDKLITGDSQEEALMFLKHAAKELIGKPIDIELIHKHLSRLEEKIGFSSQTGKATLDMACYDIIGKKEGKPVYKLLGASEPQIVPSTLTIGIKSLEETAESARRYMELFKAYGLKRIKLKLSGNPDEDVKRVMKVADVFPGELTLDANQGYKDPKAAVTTFNKLYEMFGSRLLFIEEPCQKGNLEMMKYVTDHSLIPIFADETVTTLEDAKKVIEQNCASGINIKLQKVGGIYYATKIADLAGKKELKLMVGCNEETYLATSASINFVAGTPNVLSADLDSDLLLFDINIVCEDSKDSFRDGARMPTGKPGLGVEITDWMKSIINRRLVFTPIA